MFRPYNSITLNIAGTVVLGVNVTGGGPPPVSQWNVLDDAGTSYACSTTVLDYLGASYTCGTTVLDSSGNSYTPT